MALGVIEMRTFLTVYCTSFALVQPAAQGLHPALDQPRGGGAGSPDANGDFGERPALQVAQSDRLPLVVGERRQRLRQAIGLFPSDGLLAGRGEVGVEVLLQGRPAAV